MHGEVIPVTSCFVADLVVNRLVLRPIGKMCGGKGGRRRGKEWRGRKEGRKDATWEGGEVAGSGSKDTGWKCCVNFKTQAKIK